MAIFTNTTFGIITTNRMRKSSPCCLYMVALLFLFCQVSKAQVTNIATGAVVTVAVSATATTPGDVNIDAGAAFNNNGSLLLAGNWTNNGTFTDASGTVTFYATTTGKTISGLLTGSNKFYDLIFNGIGGAWSFNNNAEAGGNLSLANGAVTAPAVITLNGNFTETNGSFVHNTGLVIFKGSTAQSYTASNPISFYNLTNNNTFGLPGLSINSNLVVENELRLNTLSKLNLVSGDITLRSAGSQTANVAAVPNEANIITYGSGRFIIERYIPTGITHGKSWQLLAAPASGQTINQSWMEGATFPNANPNPTYGTQISGTTGVAGGFDATATVPAMKYYIPASNSWAEVGNPTTTSIHNTNGYFLFVRGDRTVINFSGPNSNPLPTRLRTKGTIQVGAISSPAVSAGLFQSVANPYPSAIDYNVISRTGGVDPNFYLFDPTLYGSYGFGGYQTIAAATGYLATPGNVATSSTIYNSTDSYNNIQSGVAFLVRATGTSGTLDFAESNKVSGSTLANRFNYNSVKAFSMLSTNLIYIVNGQTKLADGNRAVFSNNYRNRVDADDAAKITNTSENFGLLRNGTALSVEARSNIQNSDTLFYNMSGVHQGTYKLMFIPKNISATVSGVLVDKFLNTKTSVNLTDTALVDMSVTSDAASAAADRFLLIFRFSRETLPISSIKISATHNSSAGTKIKWQVTNGEEIEGYIVERSADGNHFNAISNTASNKNSLFEQNDQFPLAGDNFYRIKALNSKGHTLFSNIVKTVGASEKAVVSIYPNPIQGRKLQLHFTNKPAGTYLFELIDKAGQVIS
ncbi:MAG: hypothetical protein H7258_14805, partial [Ferruginibacter sp.]|nr:hypothetical protein [Ferruginibacter sp.]